MANKKREQGRKRGSLLWSRVDAFTAFIYSLFAHGRLGTALSGDSGYRNSFFRSLLEGKAGAPRRGGTGYVELVAEQSRVIRAIGAFRGFLSSLASNIYGIFFAVYGIVGIFMYYLAIALNGNNDHGTSSLIVSVIVFVCSVPLLATSRSVGNIIVESRAMRKLSLSFFGLPEEKLRPGKEISGTEYMFLASVIALLCGIFTYFLHSSYLPLVCVAILLINLIFAHPEAGVTTSIAICPFLQFFDYADMILGMFIGVTLISYIYKVLRKRRKVLFSPEAIFVFIFCGFMIVPSLFARSGETAINDAMTASLIAVGGFFVTYNLIVTKKRMNACIKIMVWSLASLSLAGIWSYFYNGVSDGVIYSVQANVQQIFDQEIIYIADSTEVFSVFAVIVFPMLMSLFTKKKTARGIAGMIILTAIAVMAVFIYGSQEAVIAIVLEAALFWFIYSHKTLTVLIFSLLPIGIFALLYPYLGLPDLSTAIRDLLPLSFSEAALHPAVARSTLDMLADGNLLGIGVGKHAFETVYPEYANAVSAGVNTPGTHWLQMLCWSGIGGVVTMVIFAATLCKNTFGYLAISREKDTRAEVLALFCSVFGTLIFGSVVCIFNDFRMMFLFWAAAGLLAGYIREGREKETVTLAGLSNESDSADAEFRFYK